MVTVRRFEFHDNRENSHKFWELHQKDGCYHTEYGRLSGFGRAGSRSRSGQKCDSSYRRAIANKMRKGYVEVNPTSSPPQTQSPTQTQPKSKISSKNLGIFNWAKLN